MIVAVRLRSCLIPAMLAIITVAAVRSGISHASQGGGYDSNLVKAAYAAADHLQKHLVSELSRVMPILSTSFVTIEDPKGSSAFGRLLGQQVAARFSQHGYRVIDLEMPRHGPFSEERTGKPALQIDTKEISPSYEAQAVIVGDYVVSGDLAYVSVRLVKIPDNEILTSCDFAIRLDEALKEMADRAPSGESLAQKPSKAKVVDTKKKESVEDIVETPQNDPFATGEIALNPSNRLSAKIIQARLAKLGFYRDRIDGIWKGQSKAALKEFKEARGLGQGFRWDMNTQKALFQGAGQ